MSDEELKSISEGIQRGILEAQRRLFERKAKLGENVIVSDSNGMPCEISAQEALENLMERLRHRS